MTDADRKSPDLDTMDLTLHLERDGHTRIEGFSLDQLCQLFGVIPHDRHTAAGGAFITAQVDLPPRLSQSL